MPLNVRLQKTAGNACVSEWGPMHRKIWAVLVSLQSSSPSKTRKAPDHASNWGSASFRVIWSHMTMTFSDVFGLSLGRLHRECLRYMQFTGRKREDKERLKPPPPPLKKKESCS